MSECIPFFLCCFLPQSVDTHITVGLLVCNWLFVSVCQPHDEVMICQSWRWDCLQLLWPCLNISSQGLRLDVVIIADCMWRWTAFLVVFTCWLIKLIWEIRAGCGTNYVTLTYIQYNILTVVIWWSKMVWNNAFVTDEILNFFLVCVRAFKWDFPWIFYQPKVSATGSITGCLIPQYVSLFLHIIFIWSYTWNDQMQHSRVSYFKILYFVAVFWQHHWYLYCSMC